MKREEIVKALSQVIEPQSKRDILSNHMVENLRIEENSVQFDLVLASMNSPHKFELHAACTQAVQNIYPDAIVNVHMRAASNQKAQQQAPSRKLPQVKNVIAVASGKGGVGKSTVSVNLALGLKALGAKVGILDADIYGPSIPIMMGMQGQKPQVKKLNGKSTILPLQAYDIPMISMGFIVEPEQAVVLRGPRLAGILNQFISEVYWEALDFLIVDLPPGTGDVQLSLAQSVPITGAVIVSTPQDVAVADAMKAISMFQMESIEVPILGVVENMSWFTPLELPDNKYYLFGKGGGKKLAKLGETVLLGQVPIVQSIREAGDAGVPVMLSDDPQSEPTKQAILDISKNLLRQVAIRHEYLEPTKIVKLKD